MRLQMGLASYVIALHYIGWCCMHRTAFSFLSQGVGYADREILIILISLES